MNARKLLFYLIAALLGGCVPVLSLHPLFNEKDIVFDEKLLGTWEEPNTVWEFKRADKNENAYRLIYSDKEGKKGLFVAHLVKLKDNLFLDACPVLWEPEDPNMIEWAYNTLFLIPAHTFIKINSLEPQLKMLRTDDEKMKEFLKADPNVIEHTSIEDKPVLTASTEKLQAFVLKYADDSRLFPNEIALSRKNPKGIRNDPNAVVPDNTDPNRGQKTK